MKTKPENNQEQRKAAAPSRGFEKREQEMALIKGAEAEAKKTHPSLSDESQRAIATGHIAFLAIATAQTDDKYKNEWAKHEVKRLIEIGMEI